MKQITEFEYRRYPGTLSFADDPVGNKLFFGRDDECYDLIQTILFDTVTILHAPSGYGKTSLLQAAVFPELRKRSCLPFVVRVNAIDQKPYEVVVEKFKDAADPNRIKADSKSGRPSDLYQEDEELARFFITRKTDDPIPVLVLDQFEELFTLTSNVNHRDLFLKQLSQLVVAVQNRTLNLKIIISIREDMLARLEQVRQYIPSILSNRYALPPLSREGAQAATVGPATLRLPGIDITPPFTFQPGAAEKVCDFLYDKDEQGQTNLHQEIPTIQLQILCSELEEIAYNKKTDAGNITLDDLKGNVLNNILSNFYDKQISSLRKEIGRRKTKNITKVIEEDLIKNERRVPIESTSLTGGKYNFDKRGLDFLIDHRILKIDSYGKNQFLVEISHDTLVKPILDRRRHIATANRALVIKWGASIFAFLLVTVASAAVYFSTQKVDNSKLAAQLAEQKRALQDTAKRLQASAKSLAASTNNFRRDTLSFGIQIKSQDTQLMQGTQTLVRQLDSVYSIVNQVNYKKDSLSVVAKKLAFRSDSFATYLKLSNERVIQYGHLLDSYNVSQARIAETSRKLDSAFKTQRATLKSAEANLPALPKSAQYTEAPKQYSSWFKEGFFLQFGDIKILLLDINKQGGNITVQICETRERGVCGTLIEPAKLISLKGYVPFNTSTHIYKLRLDRIGSEGYNFLKPAADITLFQESKR